MPPRRDGSGTSLPARDAGSPTSAGHPGTGPARYGHMVPLRGTARLIRYLSTIESTHELLTM